jgi:prepilin-type processing-associated H-X9-DG protein
MQLTRDNGAFTIGRALRVKDFTDGLSKTAFFAERTKGSLRKTSELPTRDDIVHVPGAAVSGTDPINDRDKMYNACGSYTPAVASLNFFAPGRWDKGDTTGAGNGQASYTNGWPVGMYMATMYNHVAPPNWQGYDCGSTSGLPDTPGEHAVVSARSYHPGGVVNVCFGDGHVSQIADTIDLTVWRWLGTRNGGEAVKGDY